MEAVSVTRADAQEAATLSLWGPSQRYSLEPLSYRNMREILCPFIEKMY
jgi:hypothetical protein